MISKPGGATVKPDDFYRLYALQMQVSTQHFFVQACTTRPVLPLPLIWHHWNVPEHDPFLVYVLKMSKDRVWAKGPWMLHIEQMDGLRHGCSCCDRSVHINTHHFCNGCWLQDQTSFALLVICHPGKLGLDWVSVTGIIGRLDHYQCYIPHIYHLCVWDQVTVCKWQARQAHQNEPWIICWETLVGKRWFAIIV